jgi:membrane protein YqaA with SNARE-associated domain
MNHLLSLGRWLGTFGGPGLFALAFLDSSFLSLPEVIDILVVSFVLQHKDRLVYYALMSTLGSLAGCLLVYLAGLKGGEAFLRRRFGAGRVERGMAAFRRYGLLAVLVPALLPPPAPFKIFVLLAGVARVRLGTFALAIGVGRGVRYFGIAILAVWYGDLAGQYLQSNARPAAIAMAGLVLLAGIAYVIWSQRGARGSDESGSSAAGKP